MSVTYTHICSYKNYEIYSFVFRGIHYRIQTDIEPFHHFYFDFLTNEDEGPLSFNSIEEAKEYIDNL